LLDRAWVSANKEAICTGAVIPIVKVEVITSKKGNYRTSGTLC
jgi:hypothetical protein